MRGTYCGKKKNIGLRVVAALALVCMLGLLTLEWIVLAGSHTQVNGTPKVMIIFGCKVEPWGPSVLLRDRLDTALVYLKEHPDTLVVTTGGQGSNEPEPEAKAMADYLIAGGMDSTKILLEDRSSNTWENLSYAYQILQQEGHIVTQDELILVSNGFHLARIRMLVGRVWESGQTASTLAAPCSHVPSRLKMYIREPLALVKSFIVDR